MSDKKTTRTITYLHLYCGSDLHLAQSESKSNQASDTSGQRNNSRLTRPYVSKTPAKEVAVIVVSVVTKTNVAHIALQTI